VIWVQKMAKDKERKKSKRSGQIVRKTKKDMFETEAKQVLFGNFARKRGGFKSRFVGED
jgi:hypothetical protein